VHERLVENWLDSASERSYQQAFCQMLVAQGHRVVHSTRHSPIELGVDIISIDPDGIPCAFQLKGNPGSRLTTAQYRDIRPQIDEMLTLRLPYVPRYPGWHRSYLVTNGQVDEEVILRVERLNEGNEKRNQGELQLEVLTRGDLLQWAKEIGHSLWPTELDDTRSLLEILVTDGRDDFPLTEHAGLVEELLGLRERQDWTANELKRRIASAAVLTSVCLREFERRENYFAVVCAWTQYCAMVIGACDRYHRSYVRNGKPSVDLARRAILDALLDLSVELAARESLVEGDPLADSAFIHGRAVLLRGLMSALWFELPEVSPPDFDQSTLEQFLADDSLQIDVWGEGAIPALLLHYWFQKRFRPQVRHDYFLALLLRLLTVKEPARKLPSPYLSFGEVVRHRLSPVLGSVDDRLGRETSRDSSYFAESVLHLLARTGLKNQCRELWPQTSRSQFMRFSPLRRWQFALQYSPQGENESVVPPLAKSWDELTTEARTIGCSTVPPPLLDDRFLLSMFLIMRPYRARPDVVRRWSHDYQSRWIIGPPIGP
jgi:hypothetical protein